VFDLARNLDAHTISTSQTNEIAIAGRTSGLIELNETVTWKAKHFGFYLTHESQITALEFPNHFTDEMIAGKFKYFRHDHTFKSSHDGTIMYDVIES
jgi:ligand-binding SRPBCC domain-containing protein